MSHPSIVVAERVRRRLRLEHTDPSSHPDEARHIAQTEVRRHNDMALARGEAIIDDEAGLIRDVLASVSGFGALQPFLDDPGIEEIWLNGPDRIFIARGGTSERVDLRLTDAVVRDLVERMLQSTGRRVDISQPFVDASLADGSRLHVAIADTGRSDCWTVHFSFAPGALDGGPHDHPGFLRCVRTLGDGASGKSANRVRCKVLSSQQTLITGMTTEHERLEGARAY